MLSVGRRLSAVGRWTLNVGCWLLPVGYRLSAVERRLLAVECRLLAVACCLLPFPLPAAEPAAPALVIPAPQFDAGTVTNRFLAHAFTLRNAGAAPLVITRIRACCGATCQLAATNLPPAATTELQVRLDLAGRSGAFRKTIYLHTSDPVHPITAVRLAGRAAGTPGGGPGDFDTTDWERALRTEP